MEHTLFCDGCGVEITWVPVLYGGRRYCCGLCARGGDCECGYTQEDEDGAEPPIIAS